MVWRWRDKESRANEECPSLGLFEVSRIRARTLLELRGCQGHDLIALESVDNRRGDGRRGSWLGGQHPEGQKDPAACIDRGSVKAGTAATPQHNNSYRILP